MPHIVLLNSGFHDIEREPFGHYSRRETRAEKVSFRKSPSHSCVKIVVCNWAPDVHRMYDCQVVKKKDEKRRPTVVGFGGVGRPEPNKGEIRVSALGLRFLALCTQLEANWATPRVIRCGLKLTRGRRL